MTPKGGKANVQATTVPQKQTKTSNVSMKQSSEADSSDKGGVLHMERNIKTKPKVHPVEISEFDLEDLMEELTPLPSDVESSGSEFSNEEDWENCLQEAIDPGASAGTHDAPLEDLEIALEPNKVQSWTTGKKGISAMEKKIRMTAHMLHVQFLLYHGFRRNLWLCDVELQAILLSHVSPGVLAQVEKYYQGRQNQLQVLQKTQEKGKGKAKDNPVTSSANSDSWGPSDPLVHLLGVLIHFWKKKFTINAPGIRKRGYMPLGELAEALHTNEKSEGNGKSAPNVGEKIENLNVYRQLAGRLEGSRDVGAQLFTALLRALGFETRMVFSLQPLGFSFHGREILNEKKNQIGKQSSTTSSSNIDALKVKGDKKSASSASKTTSKRKRGSTSESDVEDSEVFQETEPKFNEARKQSLNLKKPKLSTIDQDLLFPVFWTEVFSPHTSCWVAVDTLVTTRIFSRPETFCQLEPRGKQAQESKQVICYVIAYSSDYTAKDVTVRYLTRNILPGKTKGFRVPAAMYPVKDHRGNVIRNHEYEWFRSIMRRYTKREDLKDEREKKEDEALQGIIIKEKKAVNEDSISGYKNHPDFILERHLKREEAVKPGKSHVKLFTTGKGNKAKEEKVFRRKDIVTCKTIENWYREGRIVREGEAPLKRVKSRAVTLNRKRKLEQAAAENNPIQQGLFSYDQTKLYDPPPVQGGKVPRNRFGNCDIYVQTMTPKGGAYLPLKGAGKIAKKLGIDYADAVTRFEFKKQQAVPVIEGIVIPVEHEELIRDAWTSEERERKRREDVKREGMALSLWRKFLIGIRIVKRIEEEYGDEEFKVSATAVNKGDKKVPPAASNIQQFEDSEPEEGGCILRDGHHRGPISGHRQLVLDKMDPPEGNPGDMEGGFIREGEREDEGNLNSGGGDFITDTHTTEYQKNIHTLLNGTFPVKRYRVSPTSSSPPGKQAIRSLKFASSASEDSGATKTNDSSTDEEKESQKSIYFSPKKPAQVKEFENPQNGISHLSYSINLNCGFKAARPTGTTTRSTILNAKRQPSPPPSSSQKLKSSGHGKAGGRGGGRKDVEVTIFGSGKHSYPPIPSSHLGISSSPPSSKAIQKTPQDQRQ